MSQQKKIYILYYCSKTKDSGRDEWSPGIEPADKDLYTKLVGKHPCLSYIGAVNVAENGRNKNEGIYPAIRPMLPLNMEDKYYYINRNYRFRQNPIQSNIGEKCWPTMIFLTDDGVTPDGNNFLILDSDNDTDVRSEIDDFIKKCEKVCGYWPQAA